MKFLLWVLVGWMSVAPVQAELAVFAGTFSGRQLNGSASAREVQRFFAVLDFESGELHRVDIGKLKGKLFFERGGTTAFMKSTVLDETNARHLILSSSWKYEEGGVDLSHEGTFLRGKNVMQNFGVGMVYRPRALYGTIRSVAHPANAREGGSYLEGATTLSLHQGLTRQINLARMDVEEALAAVEAALLKQGIVTKSSLFQYSGGYSGSVTISHGSLTISRPVYPPQPPPAGE